MHSREEIVPACQAASISRHAGSANCSKSRSVGSSGAMVPSKSRRTRHHVAGRGDDKRVERSMAGIVCRADYSRKLVLVVGPHTLNPRRRYKRRDHRCVPTIDIAVTNLRGIRWLLHGVELTAAVGTACIFAGTPVQWSCISILQGLVFCDATMAAGVRADTQQKPANNLRTVSMRDAIW